MNFIVIKSAYDYSDAMCADLTGMENVALIDSHPGSRNLPARAAASLARRLGRPSDPNRRALAQQLRGVVSRLRIGAEEPLIICLFDSTPFAQDEAFLHTLRGLHPRCILVSLIYNVLGVEGERRAVFLTRHYDYCYTFEPTDAALYGFESFAGIYSSNVELPNVAQDLDLCFVGLDKGRLPLLREIHEFLSANDIHSRFHVVSQSTEEGFPAGDFVVTRQRLSYWDSMRLIARSRTILDVLDPRQTGLSLRSVQAHVYSRKLLTNALSDASPLPPGLVSRFTSTETIDLPFLRRRDEPVPAYAGQYSPLLLLPRISERVVREASQ